MRPLPATSRWLLEHMVNRLPRGMASHLAVPSDAPLGLNMLTMRGLERRGWVVEPGQNGCFYATTAGVEALARIKRKEEKDADDRRKG